MIRRARVEDAAAIKNLIGEYAEKGEMLPRAFGEIYDSLRDFHVYEENGEVVGVSAVHIGWEGLAELRSVAVASTHLGRGIGSKLVRACLDDARELGVHEVFVLTYVEGFFRKMGFNTAERDELPQKVWLECRNKCIKYPDKCNETALTLSLD